jgi:chromate transporter
VNADLSAAEADVRPTRLGLFLGFLKIGLCGFGGVGPWAHRVIVEERGWVDDREYARLLGLCQMLPGPNVGNVAVCLGDRFHGAVGATLALTGLMVGPLGVLLAFIGLYDRFAQVPAVDGAVGGVAAAAAGLFIGTALKLAGRLRPTRVAVLVGLLAFVAVGLLRWPLVAVVVGLAPLSIAAAWRIRP